MACDIKNIIHKERDKKFHNRPPLSSLLRLLDIQNIALSLLFYLLLCHKRER